MHPALSVTGYPNLNVSVKTQMALFSELRSKGMVIDSPKATTVWALTELCRQNRIPYEVAVAKDKSGKVTGVAVAIADRPVNYQLPKSLVLEVVESYKGVGHEVETSGATGATAAGQTSTPPQ